ncbi:hypothetical protein T11_1646 [Trichinella zimbabwensis]|uniref:Uncharacterized protein n=1 Tax=Trichinella zimbabwensis TaxID=268475 RepID=A0A0V1EDW5_9BILA|nr:hypothetical protein T11_1646 [Trichinella zimbabwensis]
MTYYINVIALIDLPFLIGNPGTLVYVADELPDPSFDLDGIGNASDGTCLLPSSENIQSVKGFIRYLMR